MSCCVKIILAAVRNTPCECPVAGYCARHSMKKNDHFHRLCQTHVGYFDMYERGVGPGQQYEIPERRVGLGDVIAFVIKVATLWRVVPCANCNSRRAKLNEKYPLWPWPILRRDNARQQHEDVPAVR